MVLDLFPFRHPFDVLIASCLADTYAWFAVAKYIQTQTNRYVPVPLIQGVNLQPDFIPQLSK